MAQMPCGVRTARLLLTFALLILVSQTNGLAQITVPRASQAAPAEELDIYLVTFRPGVPPAEAAALVQASGAVPRRTLLPPMRYQSEFRV
jgi:hypothetical protein